ncbi:unnamed protein product [Cyprideis torosa]|uniref:Uncharacterized protein n=1 Tax=Cyprideis torosa TaxID=163714 RepID=A0A7R8W438_9CRUS|nr:unnamed protein product [Cyprideis torosa]CAG0883731.1 unnamed protein product [Cyprideis torosa]
MSLKKIRRRLSQTFRFSVDGSLSELAEELTIDDKEHQENGAAGGLANPVRGFRMKNRRLSHSHSRIVGLAQETNSSKDIPKDCMVPRDVDLGSAIPEPNVRYGTADFRDCQCSEKPMTSIVGGEEKLFAEMVVCVRIVWTLEGVYEGYGQASATSRSRASVQNMDNEDGCHRRKHPEERSDVMEVSCIEEEFEENPKNSYSLWNRRVWPYRRQKAFLQMWGKSVRPSDGWENAPVRLAELENAVHHSSSAGVPDLDRSAEFRTTRAGSGWVRTRKGWATLLLFGHTTEVFLLSDKGKR